MSVLIIQVLSNKENYYDLNFWLTLGGTILSFLGILVTVYTLLKVQSITKAKREERDVLTRSLRIRELLDNLRINEGLLANKQKLDLDSIHLSLARLNTELETSLRILIPELPNDDILSNAQIISKNYWTDNFASSVIGKAKKELTIVSWRSTRYFREEMLQKFMNSLIENPNLRIKLFFVSPDAPDYVFEYLEIMLTLGNAAEIREQQQSTLKFALSTIKRYSLAKKLDNSVLDRIQLLEYKQIPNLHCVIADDEVNWGINFYMEPDLGATEILGQAYIKSSVASSFGVKVIEQVQILEKFCERVTLTI